MKLFAAALPFLAAAALALFVGALLTEAMVLVPLWQALPPPEFFTLHAAHAHRLYAFFAPLTVSATVLAVAAAATALTAATTDRSQRGASVAAAALALVVLSTYFLYFQRANASFAAASVPHEALPAELTRWAAWHWFRTVVGLGALAAALLALRGGRRPV